MPEVWYCCQCSYGPHSKSLYDYCISCGVKCCFNCQVEKVYDNASYNALDTLQCPIATIPANRNPYPDGLDGMALEAPRWRASSHQHFYLTRNAEDIGRSSATMAASRQGKRDDTILWICHQRGNGPKVWAHEHRCVICNHDACPGCKEAK